MRHGSPLQGDLQGEPGRDPEVHHQGPDHPLIPRGLHWLERLHGLPWLQRLGRPHLRLALVLVFASALAACSSTPRGEPRGGTIVYHEEPPAPDPSRQEARQPQPFTRIFTTEGSDTTTQGGVQTYAGVIEGSGDTRSASDEESNRIAQTIFERARLKSTTVLSQAKFGELWARLEEAGILDLPAYRGKDPPQGHSYFVIESGETRRIYVRPATSSATADAASVELLKHWLKARFELLNFLGEQQWTSP